MLANRKYYRLFELTHCLSRLAQLVERKTLNLVVGGSSPPVGTSFVNGPNFFEAVSTKKDFDISRIRTDEGRAHQISSLAP